MLFLAHARKSARFERSPEQEKVLQQVCAVLQAAMPLGPTDPARPMVLGLPEADKNCSEPLAGSVRESHLRHLGFWSKTLLSSSVNYSPFKKQFLACCWALVETEHLTVGRQVTT